MKQVLTDVTVCHDTFILLGSDKNTAKVVDVTTGTTVRLYCNFCADNDNHGAKIWFYKRRGSYKPITKILGINFDDNNKIFMTADHSLVVRNYNTNIDSGIYSCKSLYKGALTIFTYVLDGVLNKSECSRIGTIKQWHQFKQYEIDPINKQFEISEREPFASFRNKFKFSFRVKTHWEQWGLCVLFSPSKGIREKIGKCRLQILPNNYIAKIQTIPDLENTNAYFITENYDIACNSIILNEMLPDISMIVKCVPEYKIVEPCSIENQSLILIAKLNNSDYKVTASKQIAENGHCILTCPEATQDSTIEWFKNGEIFNSSFRNNMGSNEEEPHITIDSYNSLYIFHATKKEEGIYSCTNDGKNMQKFEIKIVPKDKLLNDDFFRYTIYLGFVLSLTMTCYCAGICVAWHGKTSFADPLNLNNHKKNSIKK